MMLKTLHGYLLKRLLISLAGSLFVFTTCLLFLSLARFNRDAARYGFDFAVIAKSMVYLLPSTLSLTLPISLLVAVIVTFGGLSDRDEFTAIKAAGVSPYWLICPVIVLGFVMTAATLFVSDHLVELSKTRLREKILLSVKDSFQRSARPGHSLDLNLDDGQSIKLNFLAARGGRQPISIAVFQHAKLTDTLFAADHKIEFRYAQGDQSDQSETHVLLTLNDGEMFSNPQRVLSFTQYQVTYVIPSELGQHLSVGRSPSDRKIAQLLEVRREAAQQMERAQRELLEETASLLASAVGGAHRGPGEEPVIAVQAEQVSARNGALVSLADKVTWTGIQIHQRMALAFASLAFVLTGTWIGLRFADSGVVKGGAISLLTILIYYALLLTFQSFTAEYGWNPGWMWAPTALIGGVGVWSLHWHFKTT